MTQFTATPEQLRTSAQELEQLRQKHLALMKQMRILIMSLSESWKGEAQEALTNSFLNQSQTMTDVANVLEQYGALIRKAADEAENLDHTMLLAVMNSLD